jgi:hypothetical protein
MPVDWLEMMQRLAAGARAKVAEDRRRLEELQAQRADTCSRDWADAVERSGPMGCAEGAKPGCGYSTGVILWIIPLWL